MALSELQYAGQFEIEELKLFSSTGIFISLEQLAMEVDIYEDIFSNAITGHLFMIDTDNLISNFPIIGQETLSLKFKTPNFEEDETQLNFTDEHKFHVYKIGLSTEISHSSNVYKLDFTTPEILQNLRVRVSKSYTRSISEIVSDLLKNTKYIGTTKKIHMEPTRGTRKYVCPNHHPYKIIKNLLKESISMETSSPHYLFFENARGLHFRTLQDLYTEPGKGTYHSGDYIRTGVGTEIGSEQNTRLDMTRILSHEIITNNDMMLNILGGVLGSKNITHDIYNKNYEIDEFNYFADFDKHDRISVGESDITDNPRYSQGEDEYSGKDIGRFPDSDIHLIPQAPLSYSKEYTQSQLRDCLLQRKSRILELHRGVQVNFNVHGHTALAAGDMVKLELPVRGNDHEEDKISKYYKGRFLITRIRHQFSTSLATPTHLMHIAAFRDSLPESLPV